MSIVDGSADVREQSRRSRARSSCAISRSTTNRSSNALSQRPAARRNAIDFSSMRLDFIRSPDRSRCATAWCAVRCSAAPSTAWSITGTTKCTCAARWFRSTAPTICSANCRCVGLVPGRRKGRLVRHHLRGRRQAGQSGAAHQSDFGAGAGPVAQGVRVPRQWRRQRHRDHHDLSLGRELPNSDSNQQSMSTPTEVAGQTGLSRT